MPVPVQVREGAEDAGMKGVRVSVGGRASLNHALGFAGHQNFLCHVS
jgi:hypothetical protein